MKLQTFIRQRSFARYIMVDLTAAARALAWDTRWLDLEGRLHETANDPIDHKFRTIAETLVDIEEFRPDLVLSYGLEYLEPVFQSYVHGFDTRFRDLVGSPAVYFLCDFGFPFDRPPDHVPDDILIPLQRWDSLVLCWDREATARLQAAGVTRARHCPLAVNDCQFSVRSDGPASNGQPLLFVGGPTDDRIWMLEGIADLGLTILGYDADRWQQNDKLRRCYQGEVWERDRLRTAYQDARIAVNVTRPHGLSSLNMRVFEAMACGSLMVTDDRSDASRLFEDGKEIVIYQNREDLRRKVRYYLAHETERRTIAEAGRRRVLQHHTYRARLDSLTPDLVRFHSECLALRSLSEQVARDPAQAIAHAGSLQETGAIASDLESLRFLEAVAYAALHETGPAEACLADVLQRNPRHREAQGLVRQIDQAA